MKVFSFIFIVLLMLSVYYISNKNKNVIWMFLTAPIIWYMAPWISPIQISTLLFLWGYYFINKYDKGEKLSNLFISGVFLGLSLGFWDGVIYFIAFLLIVFLFNKKLYDSFYFLVFFFIGLLPKLIIDQFVFGFAFAGIIRFLFGALSFILYGGVYGATYKTFIFTAFLTALFIPFYSVLIFSKKNFLKYKKQVIFIGLSIMMILFNAQIRYTFFIFPMIILFLNKILNKKQIKIYLIFSLILSLIVIQPYLIQICGETNSEEFMTLVINFPNITFNSTFSEDIIKKDLDKISKDYPNEMFLVGNAPDDYQSLAMIYSGDEIREFVSIQDYNLFLENESNLFEKEFRPISNINNRREFWISGGIGKPIDDSTDYESIEYAISLEGNLVLGDFKLIEEYSILRLFKKEI
jgi:hypothetical protein